jgi:hypothetical protein
LGAEADASFGHCTSLLRGFSASTEGVLVLAGAYEEGTCGAARLLGTQTAGIAGSAEPLPVRYHRNPVRIGEPIEFGGPAGTVDTYLVVFDVRGRVIHRTHRAGNTPLVWTGLSLSGRYVSPGTYFYLLRPAARRGKIVLIR